MCTCVRHVHCRMSIDPGHPVYFMQLKANVLVLGLANSGKTTIVNTLLAQAEEDVAPTVGFNVENLSFDRCNLTIMDMSGQEKYHPLWEIHYQDTKVC